MKVIEELLLDAYLGEDPEHRPVVVTDGRTRLVSAEAARTVSDDALALLERHAAGLVHDDAPGDPGADRLGARTPARAAQALGIARATVYRKLRSYGI
ncbi:hypothetical protein [Actinacidiphila soli]|uniref:hypothetical protein n=1 Tax=Actinacidiphila soli TaxID=2487275 RepID=UPI000FCC7C79|nr:hypothetical protein [Actinacidiphila soli]